MRLLTLTAATACFIFTVQTVAQASPPAICFDKAKVTLVKVHDNYDVHFSTSESTSGSNFDYGKTKSGINEASTQGMHQMLSLALATGIKVRGEADDKSDCEKQVIKSLTLLAD